METLKSLGYVGFAIGVLTGFAIGTALFGFPLMKCETKLIILEEALR